jgi:hypothetical protein
MIKSHVMVKAAALLAAPQHLPPGDLGGNPVFSGLSGGAVVEGGPVAAQAAMLTASPTASGQS